MKQNTLYDRISFYNFITVMLEYQFASDLAVDFSLWGVFSFKLDYIKMLGLRAPT